MAEAAAFDWDEANAGHIARHGVTLQEDAFANEPPLVLAGQKRSGEERMLCAGLTDSGRSIQFVYTIRGGRIRVITARTAKRESEGAAMRAKTSPVVVDTPVFRCEAEEAAWWDLHRELTADLLLKHGRHGAVPTRSVSVRLPVTDIARARKLAEKQGVGYQTVIKTLLHEALKKESVGPGQ